MYMCIDFTEISGIIEIIKTSFLIKTFSSI